MSMAGADPSGERGRSQCRSFHSAGAGSSSLPLALLLLIALPLVLALLPAPPLPLASLLLLLLLALLPPPVQAGTPPPKYPGMPLLRALPKGHQWAAPPPPLPLALGPRVSRRRGMPAGHSRMRKQTRAQNLTPSATSCCPA